MKSFIGKSGKFYFKNPVDSGSYSYACYDSKEAYEERSHLPNYVDSETAFEDYDTEKESWGYCFTIFNGQYEKVSFKTTLLGQLLEEVNGFKLGKDYLSSLRKEYGDKFRYKYEKCELCET